MHMIFQTTSAMTSENNCTSSGVPSISSNCKNQSEIEDKDDLNPNSCKQMTTDTHQINTDCSDDDDDDDLMPYPISPSNEEYENQIQFLNDAQLIGRAEICFGVMDDEKFTNANNDKRNFCSDIVQIDDDDLSISSDLSITPEFFSQLPLDISTSCPMTIDNDDEDFDDTNNREFPRNDESNERNRIVSVISMDSFGDEIGQLNTYVDIQ